MLMRQVQWTQHQSQTQRAPPCRRSRAPGQWRTPDIQTPWTTHPAAASLTAPPCRSQARFVPHPLNPLSLTTYHAFVITSSVQDEALLYHASSQSRGSSSPSGAASLLGVMQHNAPSLADEESLLAICS